MGLPRVYRWTRSAAYSVHPRRRIGLTQMRAGRPEGASRARCKMLAHEAIGRALAGDERSDGAEKARSAFMAQLPLERGTGLVAALRLCLGALVLPSATGTDRILQSLASRWTEATGNGSAADAHVLLVAAVMLNGDLHGTARARHERMSEEQFTRNLSGMRGADVNGENGAPRRRAPAVHARAEAARWQGRISTPRCWRRSTATSRRCARAVATAAARPPAGVPTLPA